MVLVDALVAEDAADFVHLVQPAYDETLQVQLGGDTEVKLLVQGVVMGDEGAGVGAGGNRHQDGGVHLDEAPAVKEPTNAADDAAALHKGFGDFRVSDKVQITLAVAGFHVAEAVPFFGQGTHPLGQNGQRVGLDGGLAGAGTHHVAGYAQEVAQVQVLQQGVFVAEDVLAEHGLHHARGVAQIQEGGATHDAHGDDTSGQMETGYAFSLAGGFGSLKTGHRFGGGAIAPDAGRVWLYAAFADAG